MAKQSPLTDSNGEVRELTKEDFSAFKPAGQALPEALVAVLPKRGRPVSASPKQPVCIRLSPDVLDAFKATGPGGQTRMDNALREWLKENRP